ncbi:hypothetical protein [Laspinema palackyanum]|nr:hypothetical protein [Laspinema sp. D2c]
MVKASEFGWRSHLYDRLQVWFLGCDRPQHHRRRSQVIEGLPRNPL